MAKKKKKKVIEKKKATKIGTINKDKKKKMTLI